jgi:polyhydroxyalkanoic acid synthase PhaR subunit
MEARKERRALSEERHDRATTDPAELWRQWFETGTRVWSDALEGAREAQVDPYGLYRQWFEGLYDAGTRSSNAGGAGGFGPVGAGTSEDKVPANQQDQMAEAQRLWQQWFESATASWQRALGVTAEAVDLAPKWAEALEKTRRNFVEAEGFPTDPLQFVTRWYNATSGPFGEFVGELIEREDLLGASSQSFSHFASFYRVFRRNQEEYLRALRFPVRSDIERVAGLVVNLEAKVDRIEETIEDFVDGQQEAGAASDETSSGIEERVGRLEGRLAGLEEKMDRILAALESAPRNGGSSAAAGAARRPESQGGAEAPSDGADGGAASSRATARATDAARRKARELGVDLAGVTGTGTDGQITVEDVRRKGEEG